MLIVDHDYPVPLKVDFNSRKQAKARGLPGTGTNVIGRPVVQLYSSSAANGLTSVWDCFGDVRG